MIRQILFNLDETVGIAKIYNIVAKHKEDI